MQPTTRKHRMTIAQAIRVFLTDIGRPVSAMELRERINSTYPGRWKPGTLSAHLYACAVNQPKAYAHHPYAERFLFRNEDQTFSLYDEARHGPNVWAPSEDEVGTEEPERVEELIEASISFERDVEDHLIRNLAGIEEGLVFKARQEVIEVGRVDILAEDATGRRVVIELKTGEAKDAAVGQIARYLGWYSRADGKRPRGMLIAAEFGDPVRYASLAIADLQLVTYKVQFAFKVEKL